MSEKFEPVWEKESTRGSYSGMGTTYRLKVPEGTIYHIAERNGSSSVFVPANPDIEQACKDAEARVAAKVKVIQEELEAATESVRRWHQRYEIRDFEHRQLLLKNKSQERQLATLVKEIQELRAQLAAQGVSLVDMEGGEVSVAEGGELSLPMPAANPNPIDKLLTIFRD